MAGGAVRRFFGQFADEVEDALIAAHADLQQLSAQRVEAGGVPGPFLEGDPVGLAARFPCRLEGAVEAGAIAQMLLHGLAPRLGLAEGFEHRLLGAGEFQNLLAVDLLGGERTLLFFEQGDQGVDALALFDEKALQAHAPLLP